jgi:hypothetical protein
MTWKFLESAGARILVNGETNGVGFPYFRNTRMAMGHNTFFIAHFMNRCMKAYVYLH